VAVDRPDTGAEAAERQQAVEAPPPPADRPGDEDFPSRAESRAAAAASDTDQRQPDRVGDKPDASARDTAGEERDTTIEESTESSTDPEHDEVPAHENSAWDSPDEDDQTTADLAASDRRQTLDSQRPLDDEMGTAGAEDRSARQQLGPEEARVDDPTSGEDLEPASIPAEATVDHRAADDGQDTDTSEHPTDLPAETAEDTHLQDRRPQADQPEAEQTPPTVDDRADSSADIEQATGQPDTDPAGRAPGQAHDADQQIERPGETRGFHPEDEQPGDDALPVSVAETVDESAATDLDKTIDSDDEVTKGTEAVGDTAETPGERFEPPGDGAESTSEDGAQGGEPPGDEDRWDMEFPVGDQLVRVRGGLDPVRTQDWSNEVGDQIPDPADRKGDRIVNAENDETSRPEKLRGKFFREGTDALDKAGKAADHVKKAFTRPPTGHPETRAGPHAVPTPHEGVNVGDTVTALLSTGIVIAEVGRRIHGRLSEKRGA
jgi:hypothetical protein